MNYLQAASSLLSFRLPFNPSWFIFICPVYLSYTAFQYLSHAFLSHFQIMGSNLANWRKIKICFLWIRTRLNASVRSPLQRRKSYWGKKLKLSLYTPFRYTWGVEIQLHFFLTLALKEGEWLASSHGRFTSAERATGTHWIEGWVVTQSRSRLLVEETNGIYVLTTIQFVLNDSVYSILFLV